MKRIIPIFLLSCLITVNVFATHMRAGEITYRWISGLKYEITIVTYTYTPSLADRPSYDISCGDGTILTIPRISKTPVPNAVDISKNLYIGQHTYFGPDTYVISLEDPNRNAGILIFQIRLIRLFIYKLPLS